MQSQVSVIIPCYRCADTIERAVESVINQTLPPKEILLVEDCSNDAGSTLAALYRLQQQFQGEISISVIPLNQNGGPGSARNAGWKAAQGTYIAFLDADDAWHPKKLELQYHWMQMHPEVALTGHGTTRLKTNEMPDISIGLPNSFPIGALKLLLSNRFPARSVMIRNDIPLRFSPGKRYAEDYLLWLQIVLTGYRAHYLDVILAFSYKADFGGAGLSKHLWAHEKGELETFGQLYREGFISLMTYGAVTVFALLKFVRRILFVRIQNAG